MIRVLVFLALLGAIALGLGWVADQPGDIAVTFRGKRYETSPVVALVALVVIALVVALLFRLIQYVLRTPRRLRIAARARREKKGFAALSRGMIAASAGDLRHAQRASGEASRHLGVQPLTLLLEAQTALLAGDRAETEKTFTRIAEHPQTRILGLRGLHSEARRRGDADAAHAYAEAAHRIAPLPWAGQAVLDHHAIKNDWARALEAVDANLAQKIIDKPTAKRQRAVLRTAMAHELADREPDNALRLANEAVGLAPDLIPASSLAARLLGQRGDLRRASKMVELAWKLGPHPMLADVYLGLRSGDSATDRMKRAQTLARLKPGDPEGAIVTARAAIAARDFQTAREAMAPLTISTPEHRPSVRMCTLMADLEEAENGPDGRVREWLARAARAPRDKAWVADGIVSDAWSAVSPVTGKLDAWAWQTPPERLSQVWDPASEPPIPAGVALAPEPETETPLALTAPQQTAVKPQAPAIAAPMGAPDDPGPLKT